jgi:RHS repeat-associated protein
VQTTSTGDAAPVVTSKSFLTPGKLVAQTSLPYFDGTPSDAIPTVSWNYDPLGRPISRTAPGPSNGTKQSSTVTTWTRTTGNKTTVTTAASTPASYVQTLTYDYFGSRQRLVNASTPSTSITRTFGYTPLGEARTTTGPVPVGGPAVTMSLTYDSLGRIWTTSEGGLGTRTYSYDEYGNQSGVTDALGQKYARKYDALHRLIGEQWKDQGAKLVLESAWTWDIGNGTNLKGHVASVALTDAVTGKALSSTAYDYDGQGRVSTRAVTIGSEPSSFQFKYLPGGATQAVTYPEGTTATWTYTPFGAVSTIQASNPALGTTTFSSYTPASQPQHVTYGNGVTADLTYDAGGLLQTRVLWDGSGNPIVAEAYVRDDLLRFTQIIDCMAQANAAKPLCAPTKVSGTNPVDLTRSFTYSDLRLKTNATPDGTKYDLDYDAAGNLFRINGNALPVAGQQLACNASKSQSWCYDANGSLVSVADQQGSWTYAYDAADRLQSASSGGVRVASFGYDHLGRRTSKTSYAPDGKTVARTTLWPSTNYAVWAGPAEANPRHTVYIPGPTGPVASLTMVDKVQHPLTQTEPQSASQVKGTVVFYAQDHTFSTQVVTDSSGRLVARVEYGPYGAVAAITPHGADPGPVLFGGHVLDAETKLYRLGGRYYDPSVGRFLTPDDRLDGRLERQDAFHRYAFALNDPISYADPSGHRACATVSAIVGGTIAVLGFTGTAAAVIDDQKSPAFRALSSVSAFGSTVAGAVGLSGALWVACNHYKPFERGKWFESETDPDVASSSEEELSVVSGSQDIAATKAVKPVIDNGGPPDPHANLVVEDPPSAANDPVLGQPTNEPYVIAQESNPPIGMANTTANGTRGGGAEVAEGDEAVSEVAEVTEATEATEVTEVTAAGWTADEWLALFLLGIPTGL